MDAGYAARRIKWRTQYETNTLFVGDGAQATFGEGVKSVPHVYRWCERGGCEAILLLSTVLESVYAGSRGDRGPILRMCKTTASWSCSPPPAHSLPSSNEAANPLIRAWCSSWQSRATPFGALLLRAASPPPSLAPPYQSPATPAPSSASSHQLLYSSASLAPSRPPATPQR